jgi:hypothetical protein
VGVVLAVPQDEYLAVVAHWLASLGVPPEGVAAARAEALRFALGARVAVGDAWPAVRPRLGGAARATAGA